MINNIYELENGRQYIVIAEENIDNKKYVLVMECNYEHDEINDEELSLAQGLDEEFEEEIEYKIVGSTEANSLQGKISNESPVGRALIGAKVGDVVTVETQAGELQYKVLGIDRSN